ncbi:fatty acid desaturase [Massariosphaeria phaeospora]|uniref:Delta 8-(E)-sphingolipid desaturase n=1 Tax=Massariosphaeria phaeospora TaxID=100035 RepID=A0A7C8MIU8_9PLEO|nr:fatty acid desaturase [Massariosphaeria phaeospora]
MDAQAHRNARVLGRREVESLIASGRSIIIVDGKVLKVDGWLPYHPGGPKAIQHMVGRDATDEMHRFHSAQTVTLAARYQIGTINGPWLNFTPPIQGGNFRTHEQLAGLSEEEYTPYSDSEHETIGTAPSAQPSPLFEATEAATPTRKRNTGHIVRASSPSSMSSFELDARERPRMSVMDARTQQEIDLNKAKYPSLDAETQASIVLKYRELETRIQAEGLYDCRYSSYGIEALRYASLLAMFVFLLKSGWYITSAVPLGCLWHQLAFTVHDACHMGITHHYTTDSVIAMSVASYCGGLSACWWKHNHNVHHIVTNSPEHDPDIEHLPFLAVTHRLFGNLFSTYYEKVLDYDALARLMLPYQDKLYYVYMAFGRFNLYRLSLTYLLFGHGPRKGPAWWHRYYELLGQVVFYTWFGYGVVYRSIPGGWNRLLFILLSHAITAPLHVQITLSHFAMSTADLGVTESFPQKMLRTTMDVDCPQWLDFFHGGLQFQAIHHLYPRIPRHNLRRTRRLVQEFCNQVNIPYALYGFVEGNKIVLNQLEDVARQAAIFTQCQRALAESRSNVV